MQELVVGMDAGGTKTRAFTVTRTGEIVGRGAGGGANLLSSPDPPVRSIFRPSPKSIGLNTIKC